MIDDQVSVNFLSDCFGISGRNVSQLVDKGILPKASRGKYDLIACFKAYIAYQKKKIRGHGSADLTDENTRLTKAKADIAEIELDKMTGELIERQKIISVLDKVHLAFRSKLLSRSVKIAPMLFGSESLIELKNELEKSDHECLTELASIDPGSLPDLLEIESKTPSTSETDNQPVGGRKKKVKSGGLRRKRKMGNWKS